jgi:hypothetical protein
MLIRRTPAGTVLDGAMKASAEDRQAKAARYGTNDRIFPGAVLRRVLAYISEVET